MTISLPPIQGVTVPPQMSFAHRVAWYSIWIKAHPMQHLHFLHEAKNSGFISEADYQGRCYNHTMTRIEHT